MREKLQSKVSVLEKEKKDLLSAQSDAEAKISEMQIILKELGGNDTSKRLLDLKSTIGELKRGINFWFCFIRNFLVW